MSGIFLTFDEMANYFSTYGRDKELKKSFLWIKKAKKSDIDEKVARKKYFRDLLIETICRNVYVVPTISLKFADQIYHYLGGDKSMIKVRRCLGELLRRCHCKVNSLKYNEDGSREKDYHGDIGYVFDTIEIHPSYLKEYNCMLTWTISSLGQTKRIFCQKYISNIEQSVANFLLFKSWLSRLSQICPDEIITYIHNSCQKDADLDFVNNLKACLNEKVFCIIGEGGTGKTVTIEIICGLCQRYNIDYRVVAFTGKAIANLKERVKSLNSDKLSTIHSLYGKYQKYLQNPDKEPPIFSNHQGFLIFEEASMVSTPLAWTLLKCVLDAQDNCQIAFVGDDNQLPPIGWGQLFDNILRSQCFRTYRLTKNYRLQTDSGRILHPNSLCFKQTSTDTTFFFDSIYCRHLTDKLLTECLNLYRDSQNYNHVICITPFNKRKDELNLYFQSQLRQNDEFIEFGLSRKQRWSLYDRVIITRNSNANNVYNGTEGLIIDLHAHVDVKFDSKYNYLYMDISGSCRYSRYTSQMLSCRALSIQLLKDPKTIIHIPLCHQFETSSLDDDEKQFSNINSIITISDLDLAYCLTTHKSQGSEAKIVFFDCQLSYDPTRYIPGGRSNIYTAITRPKEKFIYYGPLHLFHSSLPKKHETHDRLSYFLSSLSSSPSSTPN